MGTETISQTTAGSYIWVAPIGCNTVLVQLWGGGGTGGPATGNPARAGGGAGGCYVSYQQSVSARSTYGYVVAAVATSNADNLVNGNDSTFDTSSVNAKGGIGGPVCTGTSGLGATASTTGCLPVAGATIYAGGNGGDGTAGGYSGGGGGGPGTGGAGGNASLQTAGTGTATGGGNGGAGVNTANTRNAGNQAGGGGSGGLATGSTNRRGGDGAAGRADLTWEDPQVTIFLLGVQ